MRAWDLTGIAWELHEGLWLSGELLESVEDVILGILSASTFLCYIRSDDKEAARTGHLTTDNDSPN